MKYIFTIVFVIAISASAFCQTRSSQIKILKLYSPDKQYYLVSTPYDNEEESTYGETIVYKASNDSAIYKVNRDLNYTYFPNKINLSNNGIGISYLNDRYRDDNSADRKTLMFYKNGVLIKSYTAKDINHCEVDTTDCEPLYSNKAVLIPQSSRVISDEFITVFKPNASDTEKIATNFNTFLSQDVLFLINRNKQVMRFSILNGQILSTTNFLSSYPYIKAWNRSNVAEVTTLESPKIYALPALKNGGSFAAELAAHLGMKLVSTSKEESKDKNLTLVIDCIIDRNGKATVISVKADSGLNRDSIITFLNAAQFNMPNLPPQLSHWRISGVYINLRSK